MHRHILLGTRAEHDGKINPCKISVDNSFAIVVYWYIFRFLSSSSKSINYIFAFETKDFVWFVGIVVDIGYRKECWDS